MFHETKRSPISEQPESPGDHAKYPVFALISRGSMATENEFGEGILSLHAAFVESYETQ